MLRRTFLKENRSNWYQSMMLTGKLDGHFLEIEKTAQERMEILVEGLLQKHPAPDKEADPLALPCIRKDLPVAGPVGGQRI